VQRDTLQHTRQLRARIDVSLAYAAFGFHARAEARARTLDRPFHSSCGILPARPVLAAGSVAGFNGFGVAFNQLDYGDTGEGACRYALWCTYCCTSSFQLPLRANFSARVGSTQAA
jgi:hypothetical protein